MDTPSADFEDGSKNDSSSDVDDSEMDRRSSTSISETGPKFSETASTPIVGAKVTAALEGSLATQPVETGEFGAFGLNVPPGAEEVELRVTAPTDGSAIFPDYLTKIRVDSDDQDLEKLVVSVPPLDVEPFTARLQVVSIAADGSHVPVPDAQLSVVGRLAASSNGGSLTRVATTDRHGIASFTALPGAYECVVTQGPLSALASWSGQLSLAATNEFATVAGMAHAEIVLDTRVVLRGKVRTADGAPVSGGKVEARRSPASESSLPATVATFSAPIDTYGTFEVWLDPGQYDLRVRADNAPAKTLEGVDVSGPSDVAVALPKPSVTQLTIVRPDGSPVANTSVELYLGIGGGGAEGLEGAELLVEGITDVNGAVVLVVPHVD